MEYRVIKCINKNCINNLHGIYVSIQVDHMKCPLCGSLMKLEGQNWLETIGNDDEQWIKGATDDYPCVIAYEYNRLRELCKKKNSYAVIFCLKDMFEAFFKFETLLGYAWAASEMDGSFMKNTISLITTPNLSLGAWVELSNLLIKGLKAAKRKLPECIPLDDIRKSYEAMQIVSWRNEKIGHGAMELEDDEEFQNSVRLMLSKLHDLFSKLDGIIRKQQLYADGKTSETEYDLTGASKARGLGIEGFVYFRDEDRKVNFIVDPYIVIRKHEKRGLGVYFFDNQKTNSLTQFQAYAEGTRANEMMLYFSNLRQMLDKYAICELISPDDKNISVEESRELDIVHMSHPFVNPKHIVEWIKVCVSTHDRGIFLLKMQRGMGKSALSEKLSNLYKDFVKISDDLDVRTYHFNRAQSAREDDFRYCIEWAWENQYEGGGWARAPRISDFENREIHGAAAFCNYLREVRLYSKDKRRKSKVLMVLDGIDEIVSDVLWEFIPRIEDLSEGIYFLLTTRDPETEDIPEYSANRIRGLETTRTYNVRGESKAYESFLYDYISKSKLKNIPEKDKLTLMNLADHKVLYFGMMCKLVENGVAIEELSNVGNLVRLYVSALDRMYDEREAVFFHEVLAILSTLGELEPLYLSEIAILTMDGEITLRLIGIMRDLSPIIKVERGENGNLYSLANMRMAKECRNCISDTESFVRGIVRLIMALIKDKREVTGTAYEAAAANIVELARYLPEGVVCMGQDARAIFDEFIENEQQNANNSDRKDRLMDYYWQRICLYSDLLGGENHETIIEKNNLSLMLLDDGRIKEAFVLQKEVYETSRNMFGENHIETLVFKGNLATIISCYGRLETALEMQQSVCISLKQKIGLKNKHTLDAMNNMASTLFDLGRYEDALKLQQLVYNVKKETLGINSPDTIGAMDNLAITLEKLGRYTEALEMHRKVYEDSCRIFGEGHPNTLIAMSNYAVTLDESNPNRMEMLQRVYDGYVVIFGAYHPMTLGVMSNMASAYIRDGKYADALELSQRVYDYRKELYGESNPKTIQIQSKIASIYENIGRYREALALWLEVYEKRISTFGENHSDTILSESHVASVYSELGQYDQALKMHEDAYKRHQRVYGNNNPNTLIILSELASDLECLGRNEEALLMRREDYSCTKAIYGELHSSTLDAMNNLAVSLSNVGKKGEALELLQLMYEKCKGFLRRDHPTAISALHNYVMTLSELGDKERALELQNQVYDAWVMLLGENHPKTLVALKNVASILESLGKGEEALQAYQSVYNKRKEVLGPKHPDTIMVQNNLACVLDLIHRNEEALEMQKKAYEECREVLGDDAPYTMICLENLAGLLSHMNFYVEAEQCYRTLYEIRKEFLGEEHQETLSVMRIIGNILTRLGRHKEALQIREKLLDIQRRLYGDLHHETVNSLEAVAKSLCYVDRYKESLMLLQEVYNAKKTLCDESDVQMVKLAEAICAVKKLCEITGQSF